MRTGTRFGIAAGVVAALVGGVAWYLGPIAPVATGYASKIVCSGHFVSGRTVASVQEDLPSNPLVPLLRTTADDSAGSVRTTLLGLWASTAWVTEHGCTLADERPAFGAWGPTDFDARPWPLGDVVAIDSVPAGLATAIDGAFVEDDPGGLLRNTRAVVVVHGGEVVAERYAPGFDEATPLLGWSMTKSIANAMVGRLLGEGVIGPVDEPAAVTAWDADDPRAAITMEQLLQMRSGLAFDEVYDPNTDATNMLFRPVDTGEFAASKPLAFPPGEVSSYSSGTSNIVCDVLHDASGLGPEMADELVFGPLGMRTAVLEPDVAGDLVCSSYAYASARDWAKFGLWFLQDGEWDGERLLPRGWVDFTTTPVPASANPERPYGAHWWLNQGADGEVRMPSVPTDAYWASGNEGQQVVVIPSQDLVVVRLGLSGDFSSIDWGLERLLADVIGAL